MAAQVRYPALQADLLCPCLQFQVSQTPPPAMPGTTWSSAARDGPPPSRFDYAYFPQSGQVSMIVDVEDGSAR